jgi:hypothetical protein
MSEQPLVLIKSLASKESISILKSNTDIKSKSLVERSFIKMYSSGLR